MGKDKNGGYVPPKEKPSGSGRETHQLKDAFAVVKPEIEKEIAEKYTKDGADELADGIHVRHCRPVHLPYAFLCGLQMRGK
jgi:hypothetical protein